MATKTNRVILSALRLVMDADGMDYVCENNAPGPSHANTSEDISTRCSNCKKSVDEIDVNNEHQSFHSHTPRMKEKIDLYKPRSKSKDKSRCERSFSSTPTKNVNPASDKEDFNDYSDGLSVVVPEQKKKKRYREVLFNDNKEIDDEIEDQLKRKAKKSNLTVANVKSIIKHVISNDDIINYIKKSMRKGNNNSTDDLDFCYEPKLTRSKTKQLLESNSEMIWPITPIKKPEEGEHLILVNEELPEESDDEEYRPEPDDLQDQSEEESGRQSVVSSISYSSMLDSQYIESFDSNLLISDPHPHFKIPKENIGQRTRSKLCLSDTPLEVIETAYLPPDITTDMYDYECDNEDWVNFLKEFMQPLPKDPEDDEEADPEYNVMADEEVVDKEEFRRDRASKVSRREERDLYRELIEECILGPEEGTSDEEEENGTKNEATNQVVSLEIRETTIRPVEKEAESSVKREETTYELTSNQIQLIEQQMRQFVQIVTQNFLQTCQHPLYKKHAEECKIILGTLVELAKMNENSFHNAYNLKAAFALVEEWEAYLLSEKGKEVIKHMENEVRRSEKAQHKNNYHRVRFHPSLLDLMCKSDVFLYPLLLPSEAFRCDGPFRVEFIFHEDCLIAIGLEEFTEYLSKTSKKKNVTERAVVELICKYLLPTKKPSQVERHIRNVKNLEKNPINHYRLHKKAPTTVHYVIPFNKYLIKPPCQQEKALLPNNFIYHIYPINGGDENKENGEINVEVGEKEM